MTCLCEASPRYAALAGRTIIAFMFLQSGGDKLLNFDETAALMASKGMPMPEVMLWPALVICWAAAS